MNPFAWSFRQQFFAGFLACAGLLLFALWSQFYGPRLTPCPLCTFQRAAFVLVGVMFLLGAMAGPRKRGPRRMWGWLVFLSSLLGIAVAGRHVWLQHLPPDKVPACGPDLAYMMEAFPFQEVLRKVFTGSGECAKIEWMFAGLSMPAWSLLWFVLLALWALHAAFKRRRGDY